MKSNTTAYRLRVEREGDRVRLITLPLSFSNAVSWTRLQIRFRGRALPA
jgi:hypothetical protein